MSDRGLLPGPEGQVRGQSRRGRHLAEPAERHQVQERGGATEVGEGMGREVVFDCKGAEGRQR